MQSPEVCSWSWQFTEWFVKADLDQSIIHSVENTLIGVFLLKTIPVYVDMSLIDFGTSLFTYCEK